MELYERIKLRRESLNISQAELAESLGYTSRSSIAKIESGTNDLPQSKIAAFAHVLRTTPAYLMGWTDDPDDYSNDPEHIYAKIPQAVRTYLEKITDGNKEVAYNIWSVIRHSSSAIHAAQKLPDLTFDQVEAAFDADWNAEFGELLPGNGVQITETDSHMQQLLHYFPLLNAQGKERLCRYAEELTGHPAYQKKKPSEEG